MTQQKKYRPLDAMIYPRFEGIRTFMRLPHETNLTEVDFAIVGVPFDTGATFRVGARFGPEGIRNNSLLLRPYHPTHAVNIFTWLSAVDYGDLPITPGYLAESHAQIEAGATAVFDADVTPIFLGGDHSISLPLLRAAYKKYGPLALIHFDAHSDLWPGYFGGKDTHGTPFARAVEAGLIDTSRSSQIGLRGPVYDEADMTLSIDAGFHVVTGPQLHAQGIPKTVEQVLERVGLGPVYLSFDIDFVDPAFAPGTGTPEVGGFSGADCLQLLRGLVGVDFVAYDLVEVLPAYDPAQVTALLAANLVYEFLALTAVQKRKSGK
ncbi:MAG: agmatinase [Anaerolineales bacterium]|nr:agmatinase [Anaerolineales bacterium]